MIHLCSFSRLNYGSTDKHTRQNRAFQATHRHTKNRKANFTCDWVNIWVRREVVDKAHLWWCILGLSAESTGLTVNAPPSNTMPARACRAALQWCKLLFIGHVARLAPVMLPSWTTGSTKPDSVPLSLWRRLWDHAPVSWAVKPTTHCYEVLWASKPVELGQSGMSLQISWRVWQNQKTKWKVVSGELHSIVLRTPGLETEQAVEDSAWLLQDSMSSWK